MNGKPWVRGIVPCLVAIMLVTGVPTLSATPAEGAVRCARVKYFGLKGSGQGAGPIMGTEVQATYNAFALQMTRKRISVVGVGIDYNAPRLVTLPALRLAGNNARGGAVALKNALVASARRCPRQAFVLVGYSLGAWAVQRLFERSVGLPLSVRRKIRVIVLYGSPLFNPADRYAIGGNARRHGISGSRSLPPVFRGSATVCLVRDPICDHNLIILGLCFVRRCPHSQYGPLTNRYGLRIAQQF